MGRSNRRGLCWTSSVRRTYPNLKVFQVTVPSEHRGSGLGSELIRHLIQYGEELSYLSIVANVASELSANAFWERAGFPVVRTRAGGAVRGRVINVRVRQLHSPTLFSVAAAPEAALTIEQVKVGGLPINRNPAYALDLNVVLDVAQRRFNSDDAARIFGAAMSSALSLYATPEFIRELERNSPAAGGDPLL